VRFELERMLKEDHKDGRCTNYAVDESQIRHVLYAIRPNSGYVRSRRWNGLEPYPADSDGVVRPLRLLQKLVRDGGEPKPTHVLMSIGGNDARAAFMSSLNIDGIYQAMVDDGIVEEFRRLVKQVMAHVKQLILVIVYHPQVTMCPLLHMLPKQQVITELIVRFSPMFFDVARECKIPVIDLACTFNPYDAEDYGSTPIEPSNRSGVYIAELTRHVIRNFKFGVDEAKVYSGVINPVDCEAKQNWRPLTVEPIDDSWKDLEKYRKRIHTHMEKGRLNAPRACVIS